MIGEHVVEQRKPGLRGGPWGHLLVSASACLLTVSIVGSGVFLAYRLYGRYKVQGDIRDFLSSLENRTPAELNERAALLRDRPKLVEQMLPELTKRLRRSRSEQELCAALQICRPFLKHRRVRDALFELRADVREGVSAGAMAALAEIEPADQAVTALGRCLEDVPSGAICAAAVDRVCEGLFRMDKPGLEEMRRQVSKLSVGRRVWLAGYVNEVGGPYRQAWLEMLAKDGDARVRTAAAAALRPPTANPPVAKNG